MKFMQRAQIYKASNLTFNPANNESHSYDWYLLTKVIDGKMVLNTYGYSNSTIKHVYKIRRLLESLGRPIHLTIEAPKGLQDLGAAISHYESKIESLKAAIDNPRSQAAKNAERRHAIATIESKIVAIKELIEYDNYINQKGA